MVYEIREAVKITAALDYLNVREQQIGGYDVYAIPVYRKDQDPANSDVESAMYSILYVANECCKGYIGEGPVEDIVEDIATSRGKVGHSIEYLFRITDFLRENVPDVNEDHLHTVDRLVRKKIGVSTEKYQFWEELMKDPNFYALAHPTLNYKELWKHAIAENIKHNDSMERWVELIIKLAEIKHLKLSGLQRIEVTTHHFDKN